MAAGTPGIWSLSTSLQCFTSLPVNFELHLLLCRGTINKWGSIYNKNVFSNILAHPLHEKNLVCSARVRLGNRTHSRALRTLQTHNVDMTFLFRAWCCICNTSIHRFFQREADYPWLYVTRCVINTPSLTSMRSNRV